MKKKDVNKKRLGKDKRYKNETKDVGKYVCVCGSFPLRTRKRHSGFNHKASD